MIPSDKSARGKNTRDFTALALMLGMVLAVAVTSGATFSAAGSGTLQQTLRTLGFGRDSEIQAEQHRQASTLAEIERMLGRMDNEIGGLTNRMTRADARDTVTKESLARLDGGVAGLSAEMKELQARSEAAGGDSWRKPVDQLNAAVAGTRGDIITLRSSLDAYEQSRRNDASAIHKRIERLEKIIITRDAVGSIANGSTPLPEATEAAPAGGGLRGLFGLRGSGTSDSGAGHVIDLSGGH